MEYEYQLTGGKDMASVNAKLEPLTLDGWEPSMMVCRSDFIYVMMQRYVGEDEE